MIRSSVTIALVPEAKGGPFVLWDDLAAGCAKAAELGFDGVEVLPRGPEAVDKVQLQDLLAQHNLQLPQWEPPAWSCISFHTSGS